MSDTVVCSWQGEWLRMICFKQKLKAYTYSHCLSTPCWSLFLKKVSKRLYLQCHSWSFQNDLQNAQSEPLKFTGALAPVQLVKQLRHAVDLGGFHDQTPTMVTMIHSQPWLAHRHWFNSSCLLVRCVVEEPKPQQEVSACRLDTNGMSKQWIL